MAKFSSLRNLLLAVSLLLLITGAVLRLRQLPMAWYFIGAAFLLYIVARFFLKR